jgi:VWA domain-containing protein
MRFRLLCLVCLIAIPSLSLVAAGQQSPGSSSVSFRALISDKKGHPVQVTSADLKLTIGDETREITDAKRNQTPLGFLVLVDISGSQLDKTQFVQEHVPKIVEGLEKRGRGYLGLFGEQTIISDQPVTQADAKRILSKIKPAGGTSLYDALLHACNFLAIDGGRRDSIILVSDMDDEKSSYTLQQAIDCLTQKRINVYVIATLGQELREPARAQKTAIDLANLTGGRAFLMTSPQDFDKELVESIDCDYVITFRAVRGEGPKYQNVKLAPSNGQNLRFAIAQPLTVSPD